jgi:hypothetical protein
VLTATLAVTVEHLARGTLVVNEFYGVSADELPTPIVGMPVEVTVPWRLIFTFMVNESSLDGNRHD